MPDTPYTNGGDWREFAEFLRQSIASHDRQLGEITDQIAALKERDNAMSARIAQVLEMTANNATTAERLLAIAQAHETRIDRLEGGAQ